MLENDNQKYNRIILQIEKNKYKSGYNIKNLNYKKQITDDGKDIKQSLTLKNLIVVLESLYFLKIVKGVILKNCNLNVDGFNIKETDMQNIELVIRFFKKVQENNNLKMGINA